MVKAEPVAPISLSPRRLRSRTTRVTTTSALATSAGPSVQVKQETEVSLKVEDAPAESSALPERKKRKYTKKKKVEVKVEAEAKVNVEREREVKQETSTSSKGKGKEISPAPFTAPRAVEAGSSFTCVLPQPVLPDDLGCDEPDMAEPSKIAKTDKAVKGKGKDSVKRTKRFRDKAPQTIMQRAERVRTQRMFMLNRQKLGDLEEKFQVLGSTGNVYTVMIDSEPSCDCPDFRKGNAPCKHVIFIFLKVLKVPEQSLLWFQRSLLTDELQQIFSAAPLSPHDAVAASANVRKAYLKATSAAGADEDDANQAGSSKEDTFPGKRLESVGDDCPVCYEEMTGADEKGKRLVYDHALTGCGKALHKVCFDTWAATLRGKAESITCVWCRAPWPIVAHTAQASGSGVTIARGGYINMAAVAGISRVRDTSTYHFPWRRAYQEDW